MTELAGGRLVLLLQAVDVSNKAGDRLNDSEKLDVIKNYFLELVEVSPCLHQFTVSEKLTNLKRCTSTNTQ